MATYVVYAQKNCIEPLSYASTAYVVSSYGPRFFSTVLEKFGQLATIFGQMVYRPPDRKFPVRLCKAASTVSGVWGIYQLPADYI